ncbi:MAG: leucine-rich repeat domain-containing protein, partial [Prevotella sp.]|nr:leucine-rich repeat domain-containing protein [Prevotella sp.]
MKRFLSLALLALFCLVTGIAYADNITDDNGVVYTVSGTNATVAAQAANGGVYTNVAVVIPETVTSDGVTYTVTALAENAFYDTKYNGNGGPTSITLPTTITSIGNNAFNMCTNLTEMTIPEGVTSIGDGAFSGCTAIKTISLPSTLTSIGTKEFSKCTAMTDLTCLATTAPTLPTVSQASQSPFNGISQAINLWVPCGSSSSYSTWTSMMSSYSSGGSFTVSELECTGDEDNSGTDDENGDDQEDNGDDEDNSGSTTEGYTYTFNPADGATISSLSEITVSCSEEFICSWNYTKDVTVTNDDTNDVVYSADCEDGDTYYDQVIKLASTITAAGNYTVVIPEGYFVIGDGQDAPNSEELTIHYTIDGTEDSGDDESTDDGIVAITIGGTTSITDIGTVTCSVTLESAGTLTISEIDNLYTDKDCTENGVEGTYTSGSYVYTLEAGTYYGKVSSLGSTNITASFEASSTGEEEVGVYGTNLGEMTVGTEDSKGSNYYSVTSGTSYYVTYTPTSNGTLYLSDSDILCYDDTEGESQITGSWVSNGINAEGFTLTAGTTYYFTFTGSWSGEESFTAWFEADESSDVEVSSSYGESLGVMDVGTEDSHASFSNTSLSTKTNYYMTYTPDADGTLSIISNNDVVVYADAEGQDEVTGTWEGTTVSYVLTGGTTYYVVFTSGMLEGTVAYSGAWYVEMDTSVSYDFSVVSVTAADGTDLTSNITAEGKLDLAVLEDGMQMVINCTNASGYYLDIVFGTVGTEQYLTETSDRLTADENGNFTWTGGWDYSLVEGYTYPVVCTLYDAQHQGNVVAQATVLTLVGTSESTVSDVTLVSSDPAYNSSEDIEVPEGEDLTVTLTFSDYVNISAEISEGLN